MPEEFLPFHTFSDSQSADEFVEQLKAAGINFRVEKISPILDAIIIGTSSEPGIVIKVNPKDFNRAHAYFENFFDQQVNTIENDYFLFDLSDTELQDILTKPDEWGYLNYRLAQKILTDRGYSIDKESLRKLKEKRKIELASPEKTGSFLYVAAYLFIITGLLSFLSPVFVYSDLSFLFVFISFFIGRHVKRDRKVLPTGEIVFSYSTKDRSHGEILMYSAIIVFLLGAARYFILFLS